MHTYIYANPWTHNYPSSLTRAYIHTYTKHTYIHTYIRRNTHTIHTYIHTPKPSDAQLPIAIDKHKHTYRHTFTQTQTLYSHTYTHTLR